MIGSINTALDPREHSTVGACANNEAVRLLAEAEFIHIGDRRSADEDARTGLRCAVVGVNITLDSDRALRMVYRRERPAIDVLDQPAHSSSRLGHPRIVVPFVANQIVLPEAMNHPLPKLLTSLPGPMVTPSVSV